MSKGWLTVILPSHNFLRLKKISLSQCMHTVITQRSVQVISYIFQWAKHRTKAKLQIRSSLEEITIYKVEYAVVLFFHCQLPVIKLSRFSISTFIKSVWLIVSLLSSSHKPNSHSLGWGVIPEVNCRSNSFHAGKELCINYPGSILLRMLKREAYNCIPSQLFWVLV